ncbi:hypothetical protein EP7_005102 [Isosphaeraceae bacterium EP7]
MSENANAVEDRPADSPPKGGVDLNMRDHHWNNPPGPHEKRFNYFLVDSGWNHAVSKMVRSFFPTYFNAHTPDSLYILTPEQSMLILQRDPELIGRDPIILVYDLYASNHRGARGYRGFRLNLGLIRSPEQAMARLQEFVRFIAVHRSSQHLEGEVRRELHREGIDGMVKILREATTELL